jgi:integrase
MTARVSTTRPDTYIVATNTLTDTRCKSAKPGDKPVKAFDGGGLFLYITPTGSKVWRLAYRLAGKQQTISIGPYPAVSLADARAARDKHKATLRAGEDPMAPRRATRAAMTLGQATEAYWSGRHDVSPSYLANVRSGLAMHLALINDCPISSITREDLLAPMMVMNARGLFVYVRKIRVWVGQVFDWAVEHGHCKINPASLIKPEKAFGRAEVESHASLPLSEAGAFMARINLEGHLQSVLGLRMLAYTWVRTGELRMMLWSEIEGDVWRIPKGRMKRRREHLVPLCSQALELLQELRMRTRSAYVFPSDRREDRPMSENSILYLIGRCGYGGRMTGHGFRSMASTWANEAAYNRDWIERQLAHAPDDLIRATYNQAQYLDQRRAMVQAWADWINSQQLDAAGLKGRQPPAQFVA